MVAVCATIQRRHILSRTRVLELPLIVLWPAPRETCNHRQSNRLVFLYNRKSTPEKFSSVTNNKHLQQDEMAEQITGFHSTAQILRVH